MRKIFSFLSFGLLVLLSSCATAITAGKSVESYKMSYVGSENPQMEFIGYKGDSNILSTTATIDSVGWGANKKTITVMSPFDQWKAIMQSDSLRNMGTTLQNKNVAIDKSFAYFGIYSLQELELYKSQTRYVTFIEVAKNKYTIKDNGIKKNMYGGLGAVFLGCGILYHIVGAAYPDKSYEGTYNERDNSGLKKVCQGFGIGYDILGLGFLIAAGSESRTTATFEGTYNIYVYDTQKKEIIYKDAVSISSVDEFKGSYFYDESSKSVVHEYYGKLISNALLRKYDEISKMLAMRP